MAISAEEAQRLLQRDRALALATEKLLAFHCHGFGLPRHYKFVVTGGPGSGKTSLVRGLEELNCFDLFINEAAEDVIRVCQAEGNSEPWLKPVEFQRRIFWLQYYREERALAAVKGRHCMVQINDRYFCDGWAYGPEEKEEFDKTLWKGWEVLSDEIANAAYNKFLAPSVVFICDLPEEPFDGHITNVRRESYQQSVELAKKIHKVYSTTGWPVVRVPVLPLTERVTWLQEMIALKVVGLS